ncbi:MAG TPA: hypothetical protein DCY61_00395 [Dehalococcoidia bacterium]|nr:hypothetical protein [Dehalococcoidia bacterium]
MLRILRSDLPVLGAIAGGGFAIRLLHLLGDHHFILSVDSYFFFWLAEKIVAGETPPMTWHSGLAYPLAYLARFIAFLSGIPPTDALTIASKFLPPVLGVISLMVIYLAVSAIYDRRVGVFAAFTMAFLPYAYFFQAAGYVDRDGLSILLIMSGAFAFYLLKGWQWRIGRLNAGWLPGGILVAGIGQLIYLQWVWVGRWLLLFILAVFFVSLLGKGFLRSGGAPSSGDRVPEDGPEAEPDACPASGGDTQGFLRGLVARGATAVKESPWRLFLVVMGLSGLFELAGGGLRAFISRAAWSGQTIAQHLPGIEEGIGFEMPIAELQGLTLSAVLGYYQFFLIPLIVGIFVALLRHRQGDLFCLSWFLGLLILSLFAERILISAIPAACILSGVGLAFMFRRWSSRPLLRYSQTFATVVLISVLFFSSFLGAYGLGDNPRIAPHTNWQSALTFLREATPEEAVVMSWWDYGYWILALGERRPVVDNGFHGWTEEELQDIGLAYVTDDPYEVVRVMEKYGASYFVFSTMEMDIYHVIAQAAFSGREDISRTDPLTIENPLYGLFLWTDIRVKGPLEVAYRNPEVVILRKRAQD